ncbi:Fe-S cluster assembly sulfur transfer protein SufU [Candidatus Uabimicrobium amorphum]|uniref:Iron-sulfur cluster assembly scaffold protein n=1 Tax=Uabimicrobium amorphum TaxID=2596890 RepID=A0A5S9ILG1_UABAM|nr:SUF system NifU family Fe-S cluster assembly protein [Candidatus Uabimicrobium amorphum]BBM83894.1 iron-sulfur cluster assembly scaffold protein [Candidatus Uabimicrobium amorphum]
MSLRELYQEIVMDHYSDPRNFGKLEDADYHVHVNNPSCGDAIDLEVIVNSGKIEQVKFDGHGCVLSQASASMMTEIIQGKDLAEVQEIADSFRSFITGKGEVKIDLEDLEIFEGVKQFPLRVKCACLSWSALREILKKMQE